MAVDSLQETQKPIKSETLVSQISQHLRSEIAGTRYSPGDRLPSEADLGRLFGVSRTVVREAIAILRSDGLVEARKGSGVFVLDPEKERLRHPFADLSAERISDVIEVLEMRSAFEIRSARLAASRRSSRQLETILKAHEKVKTCVDAGDLPYDADYEFHYSIAEATQNKRFPQFLSMIRPGILPRRELIAPDCSPDVKPNPNLHREHAKVLQAIVDGNADAAEAAMADHLDGTLERYRILLRDRLGS
ncbi:FadR/GntR family transcriptional regulator [uncultured Cohaesibacter sp.]|uniref:FadR/GntR family transcriptional regulator n=1 Tax=uncultured Cohaesibacter sp. TaxID=1002546 RepID=UPI0029C72F5F|nr:FadR/GntR family transcriptional regulator [uncultured Cohaesibacter sp.]